MNLAAQTESTKPTIEAFIAAFEAGVNAWEAAGRILVALRNDDSEIFKKIQNQHPFITADMLEIFWNFGKQLLYPTVALLPRHCQAAVSVMPYDVQKQVCHDPVEVVTRCVGDRPVVIRKPISRLTADECKRALWRNGNLSVETQVKRLQNPFQPVKYADKPKVDLSLVNTRAPKEVGRFIVRRGVGGTWTFEKTMANPFTAQNVRLEQGQAVIVLTEFGKGQE